jgi:uncharacterized membrane protein YkoI
MRTTMMHGRATALALALSLAGAVALTAQETKAPADSHKQPAQGAEAGERTLTAAQVPAAVREAFRRAYPHATGLKYSSEQENGRTLYEVQGRDGTTRRTVEFSADGTILETETEVASSALPPAVRAAAEANGAHIRVAEIVVAGHDTTWEISIQGRRGELVLRRDGTQVPPERH